MTKRLVTIVLSGAIAITALAVLPASAWATTVDPCASNGTFYSRVGALAQGYSGGATSVEASITWQSFGNGMCSGTDPDSKKGSFAYVELTHPSYYDSPFVWDGIGSGHRGDYVRLGYGICVWSGDTTCNSGLGYEAFLAWGRYDDGSMCTSQDANGLTALGNYSGTPTYKLVRQSDGSVKAYINGSLKYTLPASATSCWNGSSAVQARAQATAWDPGDTIGGSSSNKLEINNLKGNGVTAANTCIATTNGDYRCQDTGSDDIAVWTIER